MERKLKIRGCRTVTGYKNRKSHWNYTELLGIFQVRGRYAPLFLVRYDDQATLTK